MSCCRVFIVGLFFAGGMRCVCRIRHVAFVAGAAPAAGTAAGAVAAAGAFASLPVTDHAADQQPRDQSDDSNKNNIDQIG